MCLGDLDDAVIDRMDEAIHFDLPEQPQRLRLLQLYLDKYIVKAGTAEVRGQGVQGPQPPGRGAAVRNVEQGTAFVLPRWCCACSACAVI